MPTVALRNLEKRFGEVQVIHDLSLEIQQGEFVVLVGPSGSGKSTLLRMIAGLEEISSGECRISDLRVNDLPPKKRGVAMVFQNYALYPHMSVFDNLAFALKIQGLPKKQIRAEVEAVAALVELSSFLSRKPAQLSGGQRQRVAMARAMVRNTGLFLFDEPLSNLDAKLRTQMRVEIHKLHNRLGATSIYVTHDQTEAMTLADRIVVLNQGRIEQIGTPKELYRAPKTRFVAGFLGSPPMNFFPAELVGLPSNGGVMLGVRPEKLRLESDSGRSVVLNLDVELVEYLGSKSLIYGRCGSHNLVVELSEGMHPRQSMIGERIRIHAERGDVLQFVDDKRVAVDEATL